MYSLLIVWDILRQHGFANMRLIYPTLKGTFRHLILRKFLPGLAVENCQLIQPRVEIGTFTDFVIFLFHVDGRETRWL